MAVRGAAAGSGACRNSDVDPHGRGAERLASDSAPLLLSAVAVRDVRLSVLSQTQTVVCACVICDPNLINEIFSHL